MQEGEGKQIRKSGGNRVEEAGGSERARGERNGGRIINIQIKGRVLPGHILSYTDLLLIVFQIQLIDSEIICLLIQHLISARHC